MVDAILVDDDSLSSGSISELETDLKTANLARSATTKSRTNGQRTQEVSDETNVDVAIPEKYRGKTMADVIEMHRNLETAFGRQANDLGTQRHMTDVLLGLKRDRDLSNNSNQQVAEVNGDELLANPTKAIERVVAPRETARDERLAKIEAGLEQSRFERRHPDYESFKGDTEFGPWVQKSAIRVRAAQAAAQGNWDVASELLDEYKAHKATLAKTVEDDSSDEEAENVPSPRAAARAAQLESSSQGSAGAKGKSKVYKRADIMAMRIRNPDKYYSEEIQAEIVRAYSEGRVK